MLLAHLVFAFGLTLPIQAPAPKPPAPPTIEEIVARALQTHPEILAVEAKLAGVKAELELAKLSLSQRILKAKFKLEVAQQSPANAEKELKEVEERASGGLSTIRSVSSARANLQLARVQLKEAEAEWKMYAPDPKPDHVVELKWTYKDTPSTREVPATPADRERVDILSRSVKIKKAERPDLAGATKLLQALPELKGLTLRAPSSSTPVLSWEEREMSIAGWLQFFADEFNLQSRATPGIDVNKTGQYEWFVREYGLVFAHHENKPIGAPTLAEFLKTVRGAPAPKE